METDFIPIDYDYFDWKSRNYIKIIGRNSKNQRVCVIDTCDIYLWAILKKDLSDKKIQNLIKKIEKTKLEKKANGRQSKVEAIEIHDKKFLEKPVKALKIFVTNYKDLPQLAENLLYKEIEKRRGFDLGFVTHYIIERKIAPLKQYNISGKLLNNSEEFGNIDIALDVDICLKLEKAEEVQFSEKKDKEKFKPKVLAYDIETDDIKIGEGEILMVSLVSDNYKKVITWKKPSKDKSKQIQDYVEFVENEAELLERFTESVREFSPDFLVGYFSDGFDLPFLKARAEKLKTNIPLGLDDSPPKFTRSGPELVGKINGIVHIDILKFIKTAYAQYMKSETLSLNEVSKEFLDDEKNDFKIKHSSELKKGELEDYYAYNLQDSDLTYRLFEKFWPDLKEFCRVIQEPPFDISRAGLSKYVENYVLHNLERFNEIPEKRPLHDEIRERRAKGSVEGAFVFEPRPGIYENIVFFDFTSMHTSIIISMNLSKATLLEKDKIKEKNKKQYNETPDIEIDGEKQKFYFSKKQGFFPALLEEIFNKRKQAKKEYKSSPSAITLARSNAFKVLSASVHGYIAFFGARYYSHETSASILSFVRKFNKDAIDRIKKEGYEVIYGDSVSPETKIIVKKDNQIREKKIKELFKKIDKKNLGKEYNLKTDLKVLTIDSQGKSVFKPIEYIMRHKCKKKMYRVHFTNNWSIDVTEDHSLIGYQSSKFNQSKKNKENPLNRLIEIKPSEIKNKANSVISLKKIPDAKIKTKYFPKEVYEFLGFFIGDGSFCRNNFQKKVNKDYYLGISLGNDSKEIIKKIIKPLQKKGYIKNYWLSNTRKGDIKINGQKLIKIISESFRNSESKKIIPEWLFQEKSANIDSFLRGLFGADGTVTVRNNSPIIKYTSIDEKFIDSVRKLLYKTGISHSIFKDNSPNRYKNYSNNTFSKNIIIKDKERFNEKIGFLIKRKEKKAEIKTENNQKKSIKNFEFDLQGIKKIEKTKTTDYVYDLEVKDTHRFFANYVLVHNTDSIAFLREKSSKQKIKDLLEKINSELPGIMELELDGFFKGGIWVTTRAGTTGAKKKYALIDENKELKIRGFETVRRDWCQLARKLQNKVIQKILEDGNEKRALEYIKKIIKKIKNREVDFDDLIIKTQLKKPVSEYKTISPHVVAAKKMKEKQIPIKQGNLIEYYVSEIPSNGKKQALVRERVKLPIEQGKYDIKYYLERQLLPAVENIMHIFNIEIKNYIASGGAQKCLGDF